MNKILKLVILVALFLSLSACATQTQENPRENNANDHLDLTGGSNEFLNIVGSNKKIDVITQDVAYFNTVQGYLVRPDDDESYPGIILIHEWWGLNQNIKDTANTLAMEGFTVLVVDLYNGEVAQDSEQARNLVGLVNQTIAIANMKSAIAYLRENEQISKVASMGFCFGGGQSAQLSLSDADLDATIIYYGNLPQEVEEIEKIDEPVLGIFGELDGGIPPETVNKFKDGLDASKLENDITIYDGVGHAFANPDGRRFAENETKHAWNKTIAFLDATLK